MKNEKLPDCDGEWTEAESHGSVKQNMDETKYSGWMENNKNITYIQEKLREKQTVRIMDGSHL